ncbi:MAG: monovalent cation/H+ antiporter subunit D family protein [Alphaproteobacteria bacterium]
MAGHLAVLQVLVPLLAAPLCAILPFRRLTWLIALGTSLLTLAIALTLLTQVLSDGPISYLLGDWAAPWGIEYRVDALAAFMLVLVSALGSVIMVYAPASLAREISPDRVFLFHAMYLLNLAGLLGMVVTGDVFNLFVFLEISSLSSYVLIGLGQDRRALTAAFQYLIMGTVGATFYVIGVGMMYMMTGTLNMADLAVRLPEVAGTRTVIAAMAFVVVGLGLKLAIMPLHFWLPNAYTYAPSVVSAFLAATATKVAIYALLRLLFTVFGGPTITALPVDQVLMVLGIVAMFGASAVAIFQTDAKRMLAYSSLAQIGYMVLGISFLSTTGLTATVIHLFNHALMKGALFLVLGCVFLRLGSVQIEQMAGLGRRMPWTMGAFVVGGLSLIGIPLTVGFISKWYLIQAALERGWWMVAALVLLSSLLAVVYVWRIVEVAYFRAPADDMLQIREAPLTMLVPVWLLAGGSVYFGINPAQTVAAAQSAAAVLLGGGG